MKKKINSLIEDITTTSRLLYREAPAVVWFIAIPTFALISYELCENLTSINATMKFRNPTSGVVKTLFMVFADTFVVALATCGVVSVTALLKAIPKKAFNVCGAFTAIKAYRKEKDERAFRKLSEL